MPELWRTVAENDRYEVSSLGNVRHRERLKILKPSFRCGYPYVQLGSRKAKRNIHYLVCTAWHGSRPEGMYACHRNDDKADNRPENLYWGTHAENTADAIVNGKTLRGERIWMSKLNDDDVRAMRQLRQREGLAYAVIAAQYGVTKRAARLAITGETWSHVK